MWLLLVFFSKIIILLLDLSIQSTNAEPIRGRNLLPANIPFIASIAMKLPEYKYTYFRGHFCSGSLIAKDLVLTAAHCLVNMEYKDVDVVVGATDLMDDHREHDVESWITFEQWAEEKDPSLIKLERNDVAIIKLKTQVRQAGMTIANITTLRNSELYGKNATLVGWIKGPEGIATRFLRKANVQILTVNECEHRFQLITNRNMQVPEGLLCTAAKPFAIVTKGDSGGPLLDDNNNILGINRSFCPVNPGNCTEDFADEHRFNFHTEFIDEYRRFIDDVKRSFS